MGKIIDSILKDKIVFECFNSDWRVIVGFRNILVHDYFGIDYCEIFKIINSDIFEFEKEFLEFLDKIKHKCDLIEAFKSIKMDLKKDRRQATLDYLIEIERNLKS